jgi:hypothetical protein
MDHSMETAPVTVSRVLALDLIDGTGRAFPLRALLQYDAQDPYAVTMVFMTGADEVRWVFSRELLGDGLFEPAGDGDVHVWPCLDASGQAVVIIELCSPDGEALLQATSADVTEFVEQMNRVVATGKESAHVDIDRVISSILGAARA